MRLLVGSSRFEELAYSSGRSLGASALPALSRDEVQLARRWAAAQKEAWGEHLEVRQGPDGEDCLLVFYGEETTEPDWLVYRVEAGFQKDEHLGKSRWSPTLEQALSEHAPMPKVDSLVPC